MALQDIGGSSNGRTADSDSASLGSNPSPPASTTRSGYLGSAPNNSRGGMLMNTRRRAIGLILAGAALARSPSLLGRASAKPAECFATQPVPPWIAIATNTQAGAKIGQVPFLDPAHCDLRVEIQVSASLEGKLVVYGDPEKTKLPKKFLIKPDNRFLVRTSNGAGVVDEPLCGVCTDIHDDKVSIVLPLACAPLFESEKEIEMAIKLGAKEECSFKLNCEALRKALAWAVQQRDTLKQGFEDEQCLPPKGCFITTACCEAIGLDDDCFELRSLRRYRDEILANTPEGRAGIARYYRLAPSILRTLNEADREKTLLVVYARYILPSAIAAHFGFNGLAFRLYANMMESLSAHCSPQSSRHGAPVAS
jgi:hypothetical protein